jgi:hypothetical protein
MTDLPTKQRLAHDILAFAAQMLDSWKPANVRHPA